MDFPLSLVQVKAYNSDAHTYTPFWVGKLEWDTKNNGFLVFSACSKNSGPGAPLFVYFENNILPFVEK